MTLYWASLLCGLAWVATKVTGDGWTVLAIACFALFVIAAVTDEDLMRPDGPE
ncbi:MAG: hypothetical protein ACRDKY_00145 [Solirubrobacteraceae bacterium]